MRVGGIYEPLGPKGVAAAMRVRIVSEDDRAFHFEALGKGRWPASIILKGASEQYWREVMDV